MIDILISTTEFNVARIPEKYSYVKVETNPDEEKLITLVTEHSPKGIIAGLEPFTRRVLQASKGLRVVSRIGTGIDNVDKEAACELNIEVKRTPDAPIISVAEMTVTMMLCLIKKLNIMDTWMKKGLWQKAKGHDLANKKVGIIGCGRIGVKVAELLNNFGCKFIGYDTEVKQHALIRMGSLDTLLKESDIITLHLPYTPETRNIIGRDTLNLIKPTAILLNLARGGLVDEDALCEALDTNRIAGCGFDCFSNEPYKGKLQKYENVILTPHAASSSVEGRERMESEALKNLIEALM